MADGFDISHAPFDRLTPGEIEVARGALDIGYFRPGETIIARDRAPESLFIVIKGQVEERDGADLVSLRGPGDCFDSRALVPGAGSNAYLAREETLCHLLPREFTLKLISHNARFAAFFYLDIGRKLEAADSAKDEMRASPMVRARVSDLAWQRLETVPADCSLEGAARKMNELDVKALLVEDGERSGIITKTDLADAAIFARRPIESPMAIAQYKVVAVEADDFVSRALMQMTKHNKRRVAVRRDGEYVGILEDIDLLSFFAGNARLVAAHRIERASSLSDLAAAAGDFEAQTRLLRRQGVKIEVVSEIVSDLNRQLLARTFRLTAPEAIARTGCLIVMGSEGRGEQTVRTDQDNGLILSEPAPKTSSKRFGAISTRRWKNSASRPVRAT